jgi:predicted tellurium resistance membrane protein TerC
MGELFTVENLIALLTLSTMEIVLGIDNIVFLSIISSKLPVEQQRAARRVGLALALVARLGLLFTLAAIAKMTTAQFYWTDIGIPQAWIEAIAGTNQEAIEHVNGVSWRDIILLGGGLFLIGKSVLEIHEKLEHHEQTRRARAAGFLGVIVQIAIIDMVFSLDSVITAVGMARDWRVMATAIVIAVIVMLIFAEPVSRFIDRHPTLKMLALAFLILIGVMLVAEGVGTELDRGYVYFAMSFALVVEFLNIRLRNRSKAAPETVV